MSAHISPKRLFEIAHMDVIFDEVEWPHMIECDVCMNRFADFVRQIYRSKLKESGSESVA